jgi:hypothetical protein
MAKAFIGAYWGPRKESRDQCATRIKHFFSLLHSSDPSLSVWYFKMDRKDEPPVRVPLDAESLGPILREGLHKSPS